MFKTANHFLINSENIHLLGQICFIIYISNGCTDMVNWKCAVLAYLQKICKIFEQILLILCNVCEVLCWHLLQFDITAVLFNQFVAACYKRELTSGLYGLQFYLFCVIFVSSQILRNYLNNYIQDGQCCWSENCHCVKFVRFAVFIQLLGVQS